MTMSGKIHNEDRKVSHEEIIEIIASQRYRDVLTYFYESDRTEASLGQLTEHLLKERSLGKSSGRDEMRIILHHSVLPKLADYGLIDYNIDESRICWVGHPEVDEILEFWNQKWRPD